MQRTVVRIGATPQNTSSAVAAIGVARLRCRLASSAPPLFGSLPKAAALTRSSQMARLPLNFLNAQSVGSHPLSSQPRHFKAPMEKKGIQLRVEDLIMNHMNEKGAAGQADLQYLSSMTRLRELECEQVAGTTAKAKWDEIDIADLLLDVSQNRIV